MYDPPPKKDFWDTIFEGIAGILGAGCMGASCLYQIGMIVAPILGILFLIALIRSCYFTVRGDFHSPLQPIKEHSHGFQI